MKEYNVGGDELRIKTKWGDLVARVGSDEAYPEFYISLEMEDRVEFTLGVIGQDGNYLRNRVKEFLGEEDFTGGLAFSDEEINQAWSEVENG